MAGDDDDLPAQRSGARPRLQGGGPGALRLRSAAARADAPAHDARGRPKIGARIRWSAANRLFVVLGALALVLAGFAARRATTIGALTDLSDTQVISRTSWPGQAPQIVENQVTYPLTTTMLSVPGAKTVRGYSFFGDSFVYVVFEDGTDLYWAR